MIPTVFFLSSTADLLLSREIKHFKDDTVQVTYQQPAAALPDTCPVCTKTITQLVEVGTLTAL